MTNSSGPFMSVKADYIPVCGTMQPGNQTESEVTTGPSSPRCAVGKEREFRLQGVAAPCSLCNP